MSLANVPAINNGDPANQELFNSRFAALADILNGNIDALNLAENAVSTTKIADDAVTFPKLDWTTMPVCKVYRTSTQSAGSSSTTVQFNAEDYKTVASMHSNSTNPERLTAPYKGVYGFTYTLTVQGPSYAGSTRVIIVASRITGAGVQEEIELYDAGLPFGEPSVSVAWQFKMNAGEWVAMTVLSVGVSMTLAGTANATSRANSLTMTYLAEA